MPISVLLASSALCPGCLRQILNPRNSLLSPLRSRGPWPFCFSPYFRVLRLFTQKLTGVLVVLSRRKREKYVSSIFPEATALTFVPSNNSISCFNSRIVLTLPYLGTLYFFTQIIYFVYILCIYFVYYFSRQ